MSDDFLTRIKEMKQKENEMDADVKATKKAWDENIEKHKAEKQKIKEMLNSELKKVVEVYTDKSVGEYDRPSLRIEENSVYLSVPIVRSHSHISYGLYFSLKLTEKGYGLSVHGAGRDGFIEPPVTTDAIQKEVEEFLKARNFEIENMVRAEKKYAKERS